MLARSLTPARAIAGCLACVSLLAASPARADDGVGAFRLALSGDLFGFVSETAKSDDDFGRPRSATLERLRFGLLTPRLGLELSGEIAPMVLLGITGAVAYSETTLEGFEQKTVAWLATPWIEIAFLPGSSARPFLRASIGGGGADSTGVALGSGAESSTTTLQAAFGLTGGVHLFATDDVSIDPTLTFGYRTGDQSRAVLDRNIGIEAFEVTLGVAISAWIGGRPEPGEDDADELSSPSNEAATPSAAELGPPS